MAYLAVRNEGQVTVCLPGTKVCGPRIRENPFICFGIGKKLSAVTFWHMPTSGNLRQISKSGSRSVLASWAETAFCAKKSEHNPEKTGQSSMKLRSLMTLSFAALLLPAILAAAQNPATPASNEAIIQPGVVVESVAKNSEGEKAGIHDAKPEADGEPCTAGPALSCWANGNRLVFHCP